MAKQIIFDTGEEELALTVQNVFSYAYNAMKTVLKITINESDHNYSEIAELKNCAGKIKYVVDGETKAEYEGFCLGADGFSLNYADGVFNVELTQETSYEVRLTRIENTIERIMLMLMGV